MEISAPFLVDAVQDDEGRWTGRVRVDGHVLFHCAASAGEQEAVEDARARLADHLQALFTGAADLEHQQQTERYDSLVELETGRLLRRASGWALAIVRVDEGRYVAVYQRDWPSRGHPDQ